MDRYISSSTNNSINSVNIIFPQEEQFKITLKNYLGSTYKIIKSKFLFNPIDFLVINKQNLKCLYIEVKRRNNKQYSSVIINYSKLVAMKNNYPNSLMCWEYNNEKCKYLKFKDCLLELPTATIKKQEVVFIKNDDIEDSNLEELSTFIIKELK